MTDKEILTALEPYESVLENAIRLSFIHLSFSEFKLFADIYEKVFEKKLTKSQLNCNSCRLSAIKRLGEKYFQLKNKPKKGRPAKINLEENVE